MCAMSMLQVMTYGPRVSAHSVPHLRSSDILLQPLIPLLCGKRTADTFLFDAVEYNGRGDMDTRQAVSFDH